MQVQYLVGLCCLKRDPTAVELVLGNMVFDAASETERDVDITVTLKEANGDVLAFKGYEVKRESKPLHVAEVEELCQKFKDMPSITHRAVVSASGFSSTAMKKAAYHDVELYEFVRWDPPLTEEGQHKFLLEGTPDLRSRFGKVLLYWLDGSHIFHRISGDAPYFEVFRDTKLFLPNGEPHPKFPLAADFWNEVNLRSTETLLRLPPAANHLHSMMGKDILGDSEPWSHTHTFSVSADEVYVKVDAKLMLIEDVTITGQLQWKSSVALPEFSILRRLSDREVFAATAVMTGSRPGEIFALTISPNSSTTGIHPIRLTEKQSNAIRRLALRHEGP